MLFKLFLFQWRIQAQSTWFFIILLFCLCSSIYGFALKWGELWNFKWKDDGNNSNLLLGIFGGGLLVFFLWGYFGAINALLCITSESKHIEHYTRKISHNWEMHNSLVASSECYDKAIESSTKSEILFKEILLCSIGKTISNELLFIPSQQRLDKISDSPGDFSKKKIYLMSFNQTNL